MTDDPQKRSLLDQITDSATQPPPGTGIPPALAPAASGDLSAPSLSSAPATTTGSTANLESIASSPDTMASRVAATGQSEKNDENANPSFIKKLGRLAGGAIGIESPNSSPQASLGAKIGGLIGRTGAGLALAAGTPEQKQLAEEQLQMPLKMAQIQNEQEYRRGMLGINQQNANTKGQVAATGAKTEQDKYAIGDAAMGIPEGTTRQMVESQAALRAEQEAQLQERLKGNVIPGEEAVVAGRPELRGTSMSRIAYDNQIGNVLKAKQITVQDLGADGKWYVSPSAGKMMRLGASPSVARSDAMMLRTQLPVNDAQGNTLGWVNPQTNTMTAVGDIHGKNGGPSLSQAEGGTVIPPKPTSSVLSRGQVAQTILPQIPVIQKEVANLAGKIGPGAGRWNDFWVNKGGANDPAFAGLNQDLQLYATAIGLAHFGASMPEGFVKDMMRDFGTAQSPEDLTARIEHAEGWVQGYASRIGGGGKTTPKTSTSVPNSSTPANTVNMKAPDGTVKPVPKEQVAHFKSLGAVEVK